MHRLLAAVAVLFMAVTSHAAAEQKLIWSIEVEQGSGVPDRVVVSEMRLDAGKWYSDEQIREAVYRVRKLPFVYRATYRLEPAATEGSYKLIVKVTPMRRFNMALDLTLILDEFSNFGMIAPNAHYRSFLGGPNMADVSVGTTAFTDGGGDLRSVAVGYSGYDLFRRGIALSVSVSRNASAEATQADLSPSVRAVFPLTRVQSIVTNYSRISEKGEIQFGSSRAPLVGKRSLVFTNADLLWSYDTTDDPFFALSGTVMQSGPRFSQFRGQFPFFFGGPTNPQLESRKQTTNQLGLTFNGTRYFPFAARTAARATVEASVSRERFESTTRNTTSRIADTTLTLALARNVGPFGETPKDPDRASKYRIELGAVYSIRNFEQGDISDSDNQYGLTGSWAYRQPWGFFRFTAIYYMR